ncbi:MAG: hypothetical protein H6720_27950 [Sandaracinus sp.]|nr:hypothetical protein [Sandaracinus sp.]
MREPIRTVPGAAKLLVAVFFVAGFVWRAAPLLDVDGRLLAQWPTEDGYFMLTMGRNVALGHGLSVAGGEVPTNGTQPLTTFVWAAAYGLVGPERASGIFVALVLQILAALGTALGIRLLVRRVFGHRADREIVAWVAASLWFASPVVMPHSMNCLETGFYALVVTWVALAFVPTSDDEPLWSWRRTVGFGALLGLAFWVRNDSTFLIASACLVYLWPGLKRREELRARFLRVLAFGATSVAVASPWLIYNYVGFGHLMPVSGRAEALTGHFGGNLVGLPIALAEYLALVVPIPHAISSHPAVIAGAAVGVLVAVGVLIRHRASLTTPARTVTALGSLYTFGLCAFYGLYFGAAWFLPRYFLPASPFLLLLSVALALGVLDRVGDVARRALPVAGVAALGVMTFLSYRQYGMGNQHPHFQVVDWVAQNVPEDAWVGAIQTGTLGFFHDRTVNLDGKVNIAAYEALVAHREGEYVVEDTEIQYLADWIGMRDWMNKPAIAEAFEVVVYDEEANLAVLRRRAR